MLPSGFTTLTVSTWSRMKSRFREYPICNFVPSGWQPRWFILDSGVLSYYLAPTEVHLGSRGSLKVASCDMIGKC